MKNEKEDHASLAAVAGARSAEATAVAPHDAPTFTPGPWAWFGNTKMHTLHLATVNRGRQFVMTFGRWGMGSAQPLFQVDHRMVAASKLVRYEVDYRADVMDVNHPDAHLIAAAPELYAALKALTHVVECALDGVREDEALRARFMARLIGGGFTDDIICRAYAAVASAEGRPQP